MKIKSAIAAITFAIAPHAANAQAITGNQIYDICVADRDTCTDLIAAMWNGVTMGSVVTLGDWRGASEVLSICIPTGVTYYQISDVVSGYISDHPEDRHHEAAALVILSLQEAFPCGEAL